MNRKLIVAQSGPAEQTFQWFAALVAKNPNLTLGELSQMQEKIEASE